MLNPVVLINIVVVFFSILFILAYWIEKKHYQSKVFVNNSLIYTLSIGVFCTAWAYYGCIEKVVHSGILFLAVYLATTLISPFWNKLAHKLVKIRDTHNITSIADFISLRYGKSLSIGIVATIICLFCTIPYIALQFRSIFDVFSILTKYNITSNTEIVNNFIFKYVIVVVIILFTIIFGFRKLNSTEKQPGLIFIVAILSLFKLIAFLSVGVFVVFFVFRGFKDIFMQIEQFSSLNIVKVSDTNVNQLVLWNTHLISAMFAFMFLPRQFHIAIIENYDEKHIDTASWLFPLYLFLIGIFVIPIAYGGILKGFNHIQANNFSVLFPLSYNKIWLSIFVFLGGISASFSMIVISSITIAIMCCNYFVNPIIEKVNSLSILKKHMLKIRWIVVFFLIFICYLFEENIQRIYTLVDIGMMAFACILNLVPATILGLFWKKGNKNGALCGMIGGFLVWFLGLFLPSISSDIKFFDNTAINKFFHFDILFVNVVWWSLILNISLYIIFSLVFKDPEKEQNIIDEIIEFSPYSFEEYKKENILLDGKIEIIKKIIGQYVKQSDISIIIEKCLKKLDVLGKEHISVTKLAELYNEIEKFLVGFLGSAVAYNEMKNSNFFTPEEEKMLSFAYSETLANIKLPTDELIKKIDYFKEKEQMLVFHAKELQEKINQLEIEIQQRKKAEEKIKYLSFYDKLTGLYNRAFFEEEILRIDNKNNLPVGIIGCDVNNLKLINNILGYQEGNKVLVKIAEILKKCCRDEDLISRIGGDEFFVMLPKADKRIVADIVKEIKDICEKDNSSLIKPLIAVGFSVKENEKQDIYDIIKDAEDKMYRNKFLHTESGQSAFLLSLTYTLQEKSHETKEHTERLKAMLVLFGKVLGLTDNEIDELTILALLHDIGKIAIPDTILNKPEKLNKQEWEIMKKHSEVGHKIVLSHYLLSNIAQAILFHHERWNGEGYPQGLKGEQIPLMSRILSIVDAYDVMTHDRPYKKAVDKSKAIEELRKNAETQFDPYLVEVFIEKVLPQIRDV